MSYTRTSYMAIKAEATENVAVKPDVFIPYMSEPIVVEAQPTPAKPISGKRALNLRAINVAIPAPTGDVSILVEPKTIGYFLKGIAGAVTTGRHMPISSASGDFSVGETITGGTSSQTATVAAISAEDDYLLITSPSGAFTDGETITGGTSSTTATVGDYEATVYGHEFKLPQSSLPTFTVEFGYENEAVRYTGVRFSALASLGQSDNIITSDITFFGRAAFRMAKVTAITTSGAGSKTITVDQTTGLAGTDTVKIFRKGTGFLDFSAASTKTHTINAISSETAFTVTNLETSIAVGDLVVLAPQTPSYTIDKEFSWIGGSIAKLGDTMTGALTASDADIEDFELSLTNELEPRHAANATNKINRYPRKNFLKALMGEGKINRTYTDMGLLSELDLNNFKSLQIKHVGNLIGSTAKYYTMDIRIPAIQFNNFAPSNSSEDALQDQEIGFTLYDSTTSGYFAKVLLLNDVSAY